MLQTACTPWGVYPHACGGTLWADGWLSIEKGLSPRLWGNHKEYSPERRLPGSIPTPVGEPSLSLSALPVRRVYPHACGGTCCSHGVQSVGRGLSPRLWGNQPVRRAAVVGLGSIPTPVGEPYAKVVSGPVVEGLSPRLWGNRVRQPDRVRPGGSIPTPVGEPSLGIHGQAVARVYPHACGGTYDERREEDVAEGLSPRLWGNPLRVLHHLGSRGSIPTPVGEPEALARQVPDIGVYPHAGGGTEHTKSWIRERRGLSPRLWGNHLLGRLGRAARGSIPTPVGEPHLHVQRIANRRVYPHACGATKISLTGPRSGPGLSPRLWGNRSRRSRSLLLPGSIPTPVGEPQEG